MEHFGAVTRSTFGAWVIVALVAVAACTGDDDRSVTPVRVAGTVSAPARPIIVDPLPDGWSVERAEVLDDGAGPLQSLYLAPGSTPQHGPALAVGQFQQESGYTTCKRGRVAGLELDGPAPATARLTKSGPLITIQGEINTDTPGYIFGRDLTEKQVIAAARAAHYAGFDPAEPPAEIGAGGLPAGFRRVATAPVTPNAQRVGQVVRLTNADGTQRASIVAYDGDAAADLLTQFWSATVSKATCGYRNTATTRTIGGTNVLLGGHTSPEIIQRIAANLTATDQQGFERFRAKIGEVPAAALLDCLGVAPGPDVIIEGTADGARWMLGMAPVGDQGFTCSGVVIAGQYTELGAGGLGPAMAAAGSHGIEVVAGPSSLIRDGEVLTTVGGTVPSSTTRVVISTGTGVTTEATLATSGAPAQHYFAGFLREPGSFPPSPTIVAYDAGGAEVGRYEPPPVG